MAVAEQRGDQLELCCDDHDPPTELEPMTEPAGKRKSKPGHPACRPERWMAALLMAVLACNVAAIVLAVRSLRSGGGCAERGEERREVVAPVCLPCAEDGVAGRGFREEDLERGGWRRYSDGGRDLCCPLHHRALASAVRQIYRDVLQEKQEDFNRRPPDTYSLFRSVYREPETTEDTIRYANTKKPSAHVTGAQAYNADEYAVSDPHSGPNTGLQTLNDWPLRFEQYRSATRGFVRRLTWGLVVPVSGLYRVHSMVNFYFGYPEHTQPQAHLQHHQQQSLSVVHQVTRFSRAQGNDTVLVQRNQTVSTQYVDGLTSFLVTMHPLEVGDVICTSVSDVAARALKDRWHTQGLFLLN